LKEAIIELYLNIKQCQFFGPNKQNAEDERSKLQE